MWLKFPITPFRHNFRVADDTFRNSHAAVRTDLVLAYSRRTKSSIAWLTSWAGSNDRNLAAGEFPEAAVQTSTGWR